MSANLPPLPTGASAETKLAFVIGGILALVGVFGLAVGHPDVATWSAAGSVLSFGVGGVLHTYLDH
jgi:hypothetical protein